MPRTPATFGEWSRQAPLRAARRAAREAQQRAQAAENAVPITASQIQARAEEILRQQAEVAIRPGAPRVRRIAFDPDAVWEMAPAMAPSKEKKVLKISSTTQVKEAFGLRFEGHKETPRVIREGMLLSIPPTDFPYDHCVGLEIEVEQVEIPSQVDQFGREQHPIRVAMDEAWKIANDGSLRDQGFEFITRLGITAGDALSYVRVLQEAFYLKPRRNRFSFRCGLHVHVDVSEHSMEQLYRVFLLYSVAEKLFFKISGKRNEGINPNKFCVEVQEAVNATQNAIIYGHAGKWQMFSEEVFNATKYMAMNIKPVRRYGTIEFRHHEGTVDPRVIENWLKVLLDCVVGSKGSDTKQLEARILNLNTVSDYSHFLDDYFPNSANLLRVRGFEQLMYQGVVFVKECFAGEPEKIINREPD